MTCNLCSENSCWTKASNQRADPDTSTEVGLLPCCGSAKKWAFLPKLQKSFVQSSFLLSLEYSLFPYGELQVKHHSSSYQSTISGVTFSETLEFKGGATSSDGWWLLWLSASGVIWILLDLLYFFPGFWLLWLWWKAGNFNIYVLKVSY